MACQQYLRCQQYSVRPSLDDGWVAQFGRGESGPYLTRDMGLRVAVADALCRRRRGQPVRLVVKDARGAVCVERCLCDRFPC
ncbi:MAG: hypothetical protein P8Y53_01425 [Pseudolabrys sp.]|jgi:hypothetical protein